MNKVAPTIEIDGATYKIDHNALPEEAFQNGRCNSETLERIGLVLHCRDRLQNLPGRTWDNETQHVIISSEDKNKVNTYLRDNVVSIRDGVAHIVTRSKDGEGEACSPLKVRSYWITKKSVQKPEKAPNQPDKEAKKRPREMEKSLSFQGH